MNWLNLTGKPASLKIFCRGGYVHNLIGVANIVNTHESKNSFSASGVDRATRAQI